MHEYGFFHLDPHIHAYRLLADDLRYYWYQFSVLRLRIFSIDNRLPVLLIFFCDMYSADIEIKDINISNVIQIGPALVSALNQLCLALETPTWYSKLLMVLFLVTKCLSSRTTIELNSYVSTSVLMWDFLSNCGHVLHTFLKTSYWSSVKLHEHFI